MNSPALPAALLAAACIALPACTPGAGKQPSGPAGVVTSLTLSEARTATRQVGLLALIDVTDDPQFPSVTARQSDGFVIQTTLFACDVPNEGCRG